MARSWELVPSTGKHPYTNEGCSAVVHADYLYVYGGYTEGEGEV